MARLRGEQPSQADVMQMLVQLYAEHGADGLREMLKGQAPDEVIERVIVQLAGE